MKEKRLLRPKLEVSQPAVDDAKRVMAHDRIATALEPVLLPILDELVAEGIWPGILADEAMSALTFIIIRRFGLRPFERRKRR